jgi:hypothetical protein
MKRRSTMTSRHLIITLWTVLLALFCPSEGPALPLIDGGEPTAVQVTIYTSNMAQVQEIRDVSLPTGEVKVRVVGLPAKIIPESVTVESLSHPNDLSVLEQQYDNDLPTQDALLQEFVGKKIKIIDWNKALDRKEVAEALLLSASGSGVYEIDGQIFLGHPGYKVLPELPAHFTLRPTLTWLFQNKSQSAHDLRVAYLTKDVSWRADYALVLKKSESLADLAGWVTITNQCGADFRMARLKLVAGEIHQAAPPQPERVYARMAMNEAQAPQLEEKSFFEYHLYDLKRPTDIDNKQTKQIRLLEAKGFKITEALLVEGSKGYLIRPYGPHPTKQPIKVVVQLENKKENGLGIPLPAGVARIYKEGDDGSAQFIGEDRIDPVPPNETLRITTGEAFDVVSERVQTDFKQLSARLYESEWEITLRNQKTSAVRVSVVEPMTGNWSVVSSSQPFKKTDAFTIRFDVPVPPGGEAKVTYRIRVGI